MNEERARRWEEWKRQLAVHAALLLDFTEAVCGLMRLKPPSAATKRKPSYRLAVRGEGHNLVAVPYSLKGDGSGRIELYRNFRPEGEPVGGRKAHCRVLTVQACNQGTITGGVQLRSCYPASFR